MAVSVQLACDMLVSLSRLAYEHRGVIAQIDVNPLLVMPAGDGAVAVDAVIVCNRG